MADDIGANIVGLPASLSAKAVDVLRGELGFDGVIMSDDLEMGAVENDFTLEEAAVRALKAGSDIVILSNVDRDDPELGVRVHEAIARAVCEGRLSRARIEDAYGRIVDLKEQLAAKTLPRAW
ncbi:MAG: glycoside hydrolase family 3 N-terminal domain-containing protein [Pseudomonadota bacterium]